MLLAAVPAFAQRSVRTVTNADLEKFRQQRLKAERDYADNYEKMGFPSPEELQRRLEKDRAEREALSARLAAERIQREQIAAELAVEAARMSQENFYIMPGGGGGYFGWPYGGGFFNSPFGGRGRFVWPSRVGNGQPYVNYFGPRTRSPRFPAVVRGRR